MINITLTVPQHDESEVTVLFEVFYLLINNLVMFQNSSYSNGSMLLPQLPSNAGSPDFRTSFSHPRGNQTFDHLPTI
jgi:hypothetical protein